MFYLKSVLLTETGGLLMKKSRIATLSILFLLCVVLILSSVNCGTGSTEGGMIVGRVTNDSQEGIEEADVTITGENTEVTVKTDPNGAFFYNGLYAGNYRVTAKKAGYVENYKDATVTAKKVTEVTVTLLRQDTVGSIKVKVVDLESEAIEGAEVSYAAADASTAAVIKTQSGKGSRELTDAEGYFTFENVPPGKYVVSASKTAYNENQAEAVVTSGAQTPVTIALEPKTIPTSISAGGNHSLMVMSDKTAWAWGNNDYGQIGIGSEEDVTIPIQVSGPEEVKSTGTGFLTEVIAVSGGYGHSLALKEDGTVWAWGYNKYGQLGTGDKDDRLVPVQVVAPVPASGTKVEETYLQDIIAVDAGEEHSLALKSDGTVWAWGHNNYVQLGDGTKVNSNVPVKVEDENLTGVIAISAEGYQSMALKSDGTVYMWGRNQYGQLGNGDNADSSTPVQVSDLSNVKAIAAGYWHSMALKEDGTVWAWGYNYYGQLGTGDEVDRLVPVQVSGLSTVKAIAAKYLHSMALKEDGTVWTWGYNYYGQLGIGDEEISESLVPLQVLAPGYTAATLGREDGSQYLQNITAISVGDFHSLAIDADGNVWAWGYNYDGQLGDSTFEDRYAPVLVLTPNQKLSPLNVEEIAAGDNFSLALRNGNVWAWGYNDYGQLGDGTEDERNIPIKVKGLNGEGFLENITAVSGGSYHSLALDSEGSVWAWGCNCSGELGYDGENSNVPVKVEDESLTGVIAISAGYEFSMALKSDGTVWSWGDNYYGQLGNGENTDSSTPVRAVFPDGVTITAISTNYYHSLALDSEGNVWAWGCNCSGELGYDGDNSNVAVKVEDENLTGVIAISAGDDYSMALKSDGTVWSWGYNYYGQLGNGENGYDADSFTPVQAKDLTGITAIAAGYYHSMALKSDGTVWAWGENSDGQLGNGTTDDSNIPIQVIGPRGVGFLAASKIAGGSDHNLSLSNDGTVWGWGYNYYGQVGNGMFECDIPYPTEALFFKVFENFAETLSRTFIKTDAPQVKPKGKPAKGMKMDVRTRGERPADTKSVRTLKPRPVKK
jgi:alpha-tubulin suppressor-like RCC1 family protein